VRPLFEFRLPPEYCPAQPSLPAEAGRLLSWAFVPYSTRGLGDPLTTGVADARYGPPAGFGYPLGGLRPPRPCRFCFAPAALLGFTLRSFLLAEGIRPVSGRKNPRTVYPVGYPAAEAMGRPNEPRFPGFDPSESPWRPIAELARRPLVAPLGFAPSRVSRRKPGPGFARTPPTRFAVVSLAAGARRRLGVSIGLRLAPPGASGKPDDERDSPFRVLAPERSRAFKRAVAWVIGWPCAAPCITADGPARLGRPDSLYRGCSGNV